MRARLAGLLLVALGAPHAGGAAPGAAPAEGGGTLEVSLSLGAARLAPGEELLATVELRNAGSTPFSLLVPGAYLNDQLRLVAPDGSRLEPGPGLRVVHYKPFSYPGRARVLRPGERLALRFWMALDGGRRLLCSLRDPEGRLAPERARELGVPDAFPARYDGEGTSFRLGPSGSYRVSFRVSQEAGDLYWRPTGESPKGWEKALWQGTAESAPVALEIR